MSQEVFRRINARVRSPAASRTPAAARQVLLVKLSFHFSLVSFFLFMPGWNPLPMASMPSSSGSIALEGHFSLAAAFVSFRSCSLAFWQVLLVKLSYHFALLACFQRAAAGIVTARPQLLYMIGGALINLLPDSAHHAETGYIFSCGLLLFLPVCLVTVCAVCFRGATTHLGA